MACNITITGRGVPCRDAIGGVRRFWVKTFEEDGSNWGAVSSGALTGAAEAIVLFAFQISKNTGSFVQTINANMETGSVFYSQVLEVTIPVMEAGVNAEIADLVKAKLCVVVETTNGEKLVMGLLNGVQVTAGTITTGTAPGDLHGYTLTFTAEEKAPAPVLTGSTNITYTSEA